MNRFMAARSPTSALLNAQGVIRAANEQATGVDLLEMAFQTEIGVPHGKQLCIHRTVRRVTNRAALTDCFVLENVRPALRFVTTKTTLVLRKHRGTAADMRRPFVGGMTID